MKSDGANSFISPFRLTLFMYIPHNSLRIFSFLSPGAVLQ